MKMSDALVGLFFYSRAEGHTHVLVCADSHMADGGDPDSAVEWAYEKFGGGRYLVSAEFGHESYVKERVSQVHRFSKEIDPF